MISLSPLSIELSQRLCAALLYTLCNRVKRSCLRCVGTWENDDDDDVVVVAAGSVVGAAAGGGSKIGGR